MRETASITSDIDIVCATNKAIAIIVVALLSLIITAVVGSWGKYGYGKYDCIGHWVVRLQVPLL